MTVTEEKAFQEPAGAGFKITGPTPKRSTIHPAAACGLIFAIGIVGFVVIVGLLVLAAGSFAGCLGPNLC